MKKDVRVSIDYYSNRYTITGIYEGKEITINEPISGLDNVMRYINNYSWRIIKRRKETMLDIIEDYADNHPDYNYSERLIKNVDPLVFSALKRWDKMSNTNYATEYLKDTMQTFKRKDFSKNTKKSFKENCKNARQYNLKKSNINISYDVGLFNTSSKIKFFDKVRGIILANRQEKTVGAKVNNSLIMEDRSNKEHIEIIEKPVVSRPVPSYVKGRWTRRVENVKDSIFNKKYISKDKVKKIAITGAATMLAATSLLFTAHVGSQTSNYTVPATTQKPSTNISERVSLKTTNSNIQNNESSNYEIKELTNTSSEIEEPKQLTQESKSTPKSYEEKLNEFKDFATDKYMSKFVIGQKPQIGNILDNETYSEKTDGTGNIGYFSSYPNYAISHINIIENGEFKTINAEGESLEEILNKHPDCTDFSIHFINTENGGGLGFVSKSQLDGVIQKQIDSVTKSQTSQTILNVYDELER